MYTINSENIEMKNKNKTKNNSNLFLNVRTYFREYCENTSIHGLHYLGQQRSVFEKFWWLCIVSLSLVTCILVINETYKKWERSPVIVSFATKETPIYEIPFPAVTICPETKSEKSKYDHASVLYKISRGINITETESKLLDYLSLICDPFPIDYPNTSIITDDFYKELERINVVDYITSVEECSFMGKYRMCTKLGDFLNPIITDEGLCITFNMLDRSEIYNDNVIHYKDYLSMNNTRKNQWTMFEGYNQNAGLDTYPYRALLSGIQNGLTLTLSLLKQNVDYHCKSSLQGFRVMLHLPSRIPSAGQDYFRVPLDSVVVASVKPVMITTSHSLKKYSAKKRNCVFPTERSLYFFKSYTLLNCALECLTNYTLKICGCVNFYMPRDNSTMICGFGKIECMKQAESDLQMAQLYQKMKKNGKNEKSLKNVTLCDCMPMCYDLTYNVDTSQATYYWDKMINTFKANDSMIDDDVINISKLTIYFKSSQFITSQRNELYGPTDFLANIGGLLGLFTGFSVLSLMEILYFLTVRMICNIRLFGNWFGTTR